MHRRQPVTSTREVLPVQQTELKPLPLRAMLSERLCPPRWLNTAKGCLLMLAFQLSLPGDESVRSTVSACPDSALLVKVRRGHDNLLPRR